MLQKLKFIQLADFQIKFELKFVNFVFISDLSQMKKKFFKILAKINKAVLPSFSRQQLDLSKAKKWQLLIFAWRIYVTKNALD